MLFSQRYKYKKIRNCLQVNSMDEFLRSELWNVFYISILRKYADESLKSIDSKKKELFFMSFWKKLFIRPLDLMPREVKARMEYIRRFYYTCMWYEVYDFLEFIAAVADQRLVRSFIAACNDVLKREKAAYRFVGKEIVRIADEPEIQSIDQILRAADKYSDIKMHINNSLDYLYSKDEMNYNSAIREAVLAVQSTAKVITGKEDACLKDVLAKVKEHYHIHNALAKIFPVMFGFKGGSDKIEHALIFIAEPTFHEAKFVLVSCAAFINYLIGAMSESGQELN